MPKLTLIKYVKQHSGKTLSTDDEHCVIHFMEENCDWYFTIPGDLLEVSNWDFTLWRFSYCRKKPCEQVAFRRIDYLTRFNTKPQNKVSESRPFGCNCALFTSPRGQINKDSLAGKENKNSCTTLIKQSQETLYHKHIWQSIALLRWDDW